MELTGLLVALSNMLEKFRCSLLTYFSQLQESSGKIGGHGVNFPVAPRAKSVFIPYAPLL